MLARSGRSITEVAEQVIRDAGTAIRLRFQDTLGANPQHPLHVTYKGRNNIVTDVDRSVEADAFATLSEEFPNASLWGEESERRTRGGYTWVLDPLDGTRNFASGIPQFAVSLALLQGDTPVMGMTYDPMRDELFSALRGHGAFLNGIRIRCSRETSLDQSILGCDLGYVDDQAASLLEVLRHLWPRAQTYRICGSAALGLAYVAAGRFDLYAHHHLQPWDMAAGLLLVHEAQGIATNLQGGPVTVHAPAVLAAGQKLHTEFLLATDGLAWRSIS